MKKIIIGSVTIKNGVYSRLYSTQISNEQVTRLRAQLFEEEKNRQVRN